MPSWPGLPPRWPGLPPRWPGLPLRWPGLPLRGGSRRPARRRDVPGRLPFTSGHRILAAALLGGAVLMLLIFQYQFRHLEAAAAAGLYGLVTPVLAASSAPIIWFGLGSSGAFGLEITPDCSAAVLVAPLLILGMALMIPLRLAARRVGLGLAVAATLLVAGNLLRIGVIALTVRLDGINAGYQLGHLIIGPILSIVCIAVSLALLTVIVTSREKSLARLLHIGRKAAP
jgi:exosortase/archaeosortase family protein